MKLISGGGQMNFRFYISWIVIYSHAGFVQYSNRPGVTNRLMWTRKSLVMEENPRKSKAWRGGKNTQVRQPLSTCSHGKILGLYKQHLKNL